VRTLAIDLGERRIGLALSDAGGKWATPYDVLTVARPELAIEGIVQLIQREDVRRVVVGLPLNMDGSAGAGAHKASAWGEKLAAAAKVELVFVDERLSSFAAEQQLNQRKRAGEKLTRQKKKRQLDAVAAAGFLQDFLDGKLAGVKVEKPG
jgi:putative Holliday junction resolvase